MDEQSNVTGRVFGSTTYADKLPNGDWTVTVDLLEKRKIGDGEWEEKKLTAMCTNTEFGDAYLVAMNSVLQQFNDIVKDSETDSLFPSE